MGKINDTFIYQWSKTPGFFTKNKESIIDLHLQINDAWYVSEKLDGSNMAISTDGYIASRHKIIATRDNCNTFQGLPLNHVVPLLDAVEMLQDHLETAFFSKYNFKLILYGEFMPKGSATSKFDIYNYADRGYDQGKFYAFGIGLVFTENTKKVEQDVERIFKQAFLHTSTKQEPFYLVPIDWFLTALFYKFNIDCVRLHSVQSLQNVFARTDLIKPLFERHVEGYILTSLNGKGMLKLKTPPPRSELADAHMKNLADIHGPTLTVLTKLYESGDKFINVFDRETFASYFNAVFSSNESAIELAMAKDVVSDPDFVDSQVWLHTERLLYLVTQKLEDHYNKKLAPQVKCEIKQKIANKLKLMSKYFYKANKLNYIH